MPCQTDNPICLCGPDPAMDYERHIVLIAPEIHWNTGNVGRTCLATGAYLHLIKPLGFSLSSRQVKRAGLDYWPKVKLTVWNSFEEWLAVLKPDIDKGELSLFSKSGQHSFWSLGTPARQCLVFGSETGGIPQTVLTRYKSLTFHIPILKDARSLNLSTAVGIVLYESLRLTGFSNQWTWLP